MVLSVVYEQGVSRFYGGCDEDVVTKENAIWFLAFAWLVYHHGHSKSFECGGFPLCGLSVDSVFVHGRLVCIVMATSVCYFDLVPCWCVVGIAVR